jgi:hypothetical protein
MVRPAVRLPRDNARVEILGEAPALTPVAATVLLRILEQVADLDEATDPEEVGGALVAS